MSHRAHCRRDPRQPPLVDRKVEVGHAAPPFHLDEGDQVFAPCDKVDFAELRLAAAGENLPPPALQPAGSFFHSAATGAFGAFALGGHPRSSIARA